MRSIKDIVQEVFKKHQIVRYEDIIFKVCKDVALIVQEEQIEICSKWTNSSSDMDGETMKDSVDRVVR